MNIKEPIVDVVGSPIRIAVQNAVAYFDCMLHAVIAFLYGSVVGRVIHRFVET